MIDLTKLFDKEVQRMAERLGAMDPGSAAYGQMLSNMNELIWLADRHALAAQEKPAVIDITPAHVKKSVEEDLGLDTPEEAAPQTVPFPEPFPEPFAEAEPVAEPAPKTERSYTKEEVRAALAESRKRGVKVTLCSVSWATITSPPFPPVSTARSWRSWVKPDAGSTCTAQPVRGKALAELPALGTAEREAP